VDKTDRDASDQIMLQSHIVSSRHEPVFSRVQSNLIIGPSPTQDGSPKKDKGMRRGKEKKKKK
jgi:hypothetical protein